MAEKVMIPRENRPLLVPWRRRQRGKLISYLQPISCRPATASVRRIWEVPILECPPSLTLGGDHGIYGEWGRRTSGMKISISPASLSLALGLGRWRSSQPIAFDYGMYVALHYPLLHGLKVDEGTAVL